MTESKENPLLKKRTTSPKNDEQEANPYNQKKNYRSKTYSNFY